VGDISRFLFAVTDYRCSDFIYSNFLGKEATNLSWVYFYASRESLPICHRSTFVLAERVYQSVVGLFLC
jgi:hypothetical protein